MNSNSIKKINKLKYFKVINFGFTNINSGWGEPCKHGGDDLVWCKEGDSCGESDKMCSSLCPLAACRHDGCCTGWWDWDGDDLEKEKQLIKIFQNID